MMFKKVLPLLAIIIVIGNALMVLAPLRAQTIEPDVTNNAGFNTNMDGLSLSHSVGEPAITTIAGSSAIITQGFLQPELFSRCSNVEFLVFPNPYLDIITIEIQNCDKPLHSVVVYDLHGKELVKKEIASRKVDLRVLPVGIYIVQALAEDGVRLGSFKINRAKSP